MREKERIRLEEEEKKTIKEMERMEEERHRERERETRERNRDEEELRDYIEKGERLRIKEIISRGATDVGHTAMNKDKTKKEEEESSDDSGYERGLHRAALNVPSRPAPVTATTTIPTATRTATSTQRQGHPSGSSGTSNTQGQGQVYRTGTSSTDSVRDSVRDDEASSFRGEYDMTAPGQGTRGSSGRMGVKVPGANALLSKSKITAELARVSDIVDIPSYFYHFQLFPSCYNKYYGLDKDYIV